MAGQDHPYCSRRYGEGFIEKGVELMFVPGWDTHVLARRSREASCTTVGLYPFASLSPDADLAAGLAHLASRGTTSVSLITDPVWSPPAERLSASFDTCRPFKQSYLIDGKAGRIRVRKRHRNRINMALRSVEVRPVPLAEYLGEWFDLYSFLVQRKTLERGRVLPQVHFEALASLEEVTAIAAVAAGTVVGMSLWIRFKQFTYFHLSASSEEGYRLFASYAMYAHALEALNESQTIVLGPCGGLVDSPSDGIGEFKRGFANALGQSYLCTSFLHPRTHPASDTARQRGGTHGE